MSRIALNGLMARCRRFRSDEDGSATIESLLWIPVFGYLMVMIADASFVFYGKAQALRMLQDGNRAYSTGRYTSETQTAAAIKENYASLSQYASVRTSVSGGIITSQMKVRASDLVSVGTIPGLKNITLTITARHYKEL